MTQENMKKPKGQGWVKVPVLRHVTWGVSHRFVPIIEIRDGFKSQARDFGAIQRSGRQDWAR